MMAERLAEILAIAKCATDEGYDLSRREMRELLDAIEAAQSRIAQLEAQRGEFSHIEASARYKALGLPDDVQMHAIFLEGWNGGVQQRGGAVVAPELTDIQDAVRELTEKK